MDNLTFPIISYNHTIGQSIVGGYVYRGCDNPKLFGHYIYGDTMNGRLFVAKEKNNTWVTKDIVMGNSSVCNKVLSGSYARNILTFGEDESKELYFLSAEWPNPHQVVTNLYRLVDPKLRGDPEVCSKKRGNVRQPSVLGNITRRTIFKKYSTSVKKLPCSDKKPKMCDKWFGMREGTGKGKGRRKPRYNCRRFKAYTKKFCKLTCGYCK